MKLLLTRDTFTEKSTRGVLMVDGHHECLTLEDMDRKLEEGGEKVYGKTAIPRGTYQVVLDFSNRFQQVMPRLVDVPQFTGVRIHTGNKSEDTDGCILVGLDGSTTDWIGHSQAAYTSLMQKLLDAEDRNESIIIEVT